MCALKTKILTKRALVKAGLSKEFFNDEVNRISAADNAALKNKYQQLEKQLIRKFKNDKRKARSSKDYYSDSDSEKTEDMISEIHEVERKITFMMSEIAKAKRIIEQYDVKLTRRLEKKRRARMESLKASQAQQPESNLQEPKYEEYDALLSNEVAQDEPKEAEVHLKSPKIDKFPSQGGFRISDFIKNTNSIEEDKAEEDNLNLRLDQEQTNEQDNLVIKSACSAADSYIGDYNQENERTLPMKRGPISENQDVKMLRSRYDTELLPRITNKGSSIFEFKLLT